MTYLSIEIRNADHNAVQYSWMFFKTVFYVARDYVTSGMWVKSIEWASQLRFHAYRG